MMCLGCGRMRGLVELVDSGDRFDGGEVRRAKMFVELLIFVISRTVFFFSHLSILWQSSHTQAPLSHIRGKQFHATTLDLRIQNSKHSIALESTHYHFQSASI